jgi:subtilisin family serine protease
LPADRRGTAVIGRLRGTQEEALPSRPGRFAALIATTLLGLSAAPALAATGVDPELSYAWHLQGDSPMGIASAWAQTAGDGAVVAVLDTGADLTHPDLAPNLWRNPGEIPANGVDDDRDGFVDDVNGIDLIDGDGNPSDENGHGTHVAGLIASPVGNGVGSAGVAPHAHVMIVRVLDATASGDAGTVADGMRWALAHGAKVLNLSLAGPTPSRELDAAIAEARAAGALVVTAAGNAGLNLGIVPSWPASSSAPNVLGVAATAPTGLLASISNFGGGVDIAAPGEALISTARGGGMELRTGTSMAAPLVSGTAALIQSVNPGAGWDEMTSALLAGAQPSALPVGAGTLNAAGALQHVIPAAAWRTPPVSRPSAATRTDVATPSRAASSKAKTHAKTKAKKRTKHRKAKKPRSRKGSAHATKRKRSTHATKGKRTTRTPRAHQARARRGPMFHAA